MPTSIAAARKALVPFDARFSQQNMGIVPKCRYVTEGWDPEVDQQAVTQTLQEWKWTVLTGPRKVRYANQSTPLVSFIVSSETPPPAYRLYTDKGIIVIQELRSVASTAPVPPPATIPVLLKSAQPEYSPGEASSSIAAPRRRPGICSAVVVRF